MRKIGAAIVLTAATVGSANGVNVVTGKLWHVPEATSQNAIPASVPGTTPDVTFSVNSRGRCSVRSGGFFPCRFAPAAGFE